MTITVVNRSRVRFLLHGSFAVTCFFLTAGARAKSSATAISWRPCTAELVELTWIEALGPRLECGTMPALRDDAEPALGALSVGMLRLKAGVPAQHRGAVFFNFGGPGGNPLDFLPGLGYLWSTASADHPLDGDKRRLADRYDLVAVIPRGLRGGTRFTCRAVDSSEGHDPTVDLADWNWEGFVKDATAYAAGCADDSLLPYVGTLQHVRDMERVRIELGEPVMNFVGFSYGTWVGAFYAAAYPQNAGRIVLDSVMNYAGTFEDQLADWPYERQSAFAQFALRPALAAPSTFGLGSDAREVMRRFRSMPHRAREAWASTIDTPAQLTAALTLADWVHADGSGTQAHLLKRLQHHRFSPDDVVDSEIRDAATAYAGMIERGLASDPESAGLVDLAVYHAVVCADTPWHKDRAALRAMANDISRKYPAAHGDPVTIGLTCLNWPTAKRWRPPLTALATAPPMLLVQAEFDPATPLTGAIRAFNASPNAYMVLARNMHGHGVLGTSATPCVELAVNRFLLEGEIPARRLSGCDFVPTPPSPVARETPVAPSAHAVRERLRRRLAES
jgi:pimeloyl-ACP methyl ester carboxylesterase